MKYHPIQFSDEIVRAIIEGRKTQTRRVVKWPIYSVRHHGTRRVFTCDMADKVNACLERMAAGENVHPHDTVVTKYGLPGDRLWVREAWNVCPEDQCIPGEYTQVSHWNRSQRIVYRATVPSSTHPDHPEWGEQRWRSSMLMPRWASRIELEVVSARVERLQDISEEDALAEGVPCSAWDEEDWVDSDGYPTCGDQRAKRAREEFVDLWESINGKKAPWASNQFVWRIEFKKVQP